MTLNHVHWSFQVVSFGNVMKQKIHTNLAPAAIGPYSQAIRVGDTVYLSGQIPLDPQSMMLVANDIKRQATQAFMNLQAVAIAAKGDLSKVVKLTIYLIDLKHFAVVNEVITQFFQEPYPARATIQVSALPKEALIEVDAVMVFI